MYKNGVSKNASMHNHDFYLLEESRAIPIGLYNVADVASPPSPLKLPVPVPAIVVMTPVDAVILRTRLLYWSQMYTFPEESTATPCG